jgi:hypothetical protein
MQGYTIDIAGRVNNFKLPKDRPLVPLYEAIVNSFHGIDERKSSVQPNEPSFDAAISVKAIRSPQEGFLKDDDSQPLEPIVSFEVTDNGIGFTDENLDSFLKSDSSYKADIGGKGVGRFTWLKAFNSVEVSSVFLQEGIYQKRNFAFSASLGGIDDNLTECPDATDCMTIIRLEHYKAQYQDSVYKQLETIARRIVEHCLVYFLNPECPTVILFDEEERIVLNDVFHAIFKLDDDADEFEINGESFKILNAKIKDRTFRGNRLYLCANNRLVESKDLGKTIANLDEQLFAKYEFWYLGVVTSSYLDGHVDMNRLSFDIPEKSQTVFDSVTMDLIVVEAAQRAEIFLSKYLISIDNEKMERIKRYTENEKPQFRHLLKHMPEAVSMIKPSVNEEGLDDALYTIKRDFDKQIKS